MKPMKVREFSCDVIINGNFILVAFYKWTVGETHQKSVSMCLMSHPKYPYAEIL